MTLPPARRLARYVEPPVGEKRLERMWGAVASARVSKWPVWRIPSLAAGVLALALAVLVLRGRPAGPTLAGMVIEGGEHGTVTMTDGTRLTLQPAALLRWDRAEANRMEVTLVRGEVELDVPHIAARAFTIHAGDFDIVDQGTHFTVAVGDGRVTVSVRSGRVEVRRTMLAEAPRPLGAGESWTSGPPATTAAASSGVSDRNVETSPNTQPIVAPEPGALAAAPSPAHEPTGAGGLPRPPDVKAPPREPGGTPPGPRELLEMANAASLSGRPHDAALALDALRRRYRSDPRAALAAFELGRIRLDALGDPRLAVEAFDDAIALAPEATLREDAEARRVEALDRMHSAHCSASKASYLARYPTGLHVAAVGALCAR
jgi:transmembrane sensor